PAMSAPDFAVPIDQRYFEDYVVGSTYEYGTATVDLREAVAFAEQFDPQPIHIDPVAAAQGPFGGLIASGWHTAALMMRLFVDHYLSNVASLASPGIDELRWIKPVRPGDTLRIRVTVTEARRSRSKPDRGIVRTLIAVLNQRGETVLTMNAMNLLRCRQAGERPAVCRCPSCKARAAVGQAKKQSADRRRRRPCARLPPNKGVAMTKTKNTATRYLGFVGAAAIVLALGACATTTYSPAASDNRDELLAAHLAATEGVQITAESKRATEDRILALNPDRISDADVR